jgi:hypothetical protein
MNQKLKEQMCQKIIESNYPPLNGWNKTIQKLVPGFFALGLLGISIAIYSNALKKAGIIIK